MSQSYDELAERLRASFFSSGPREPPSWKLEAADAIAALRRENERLVWVVDKLLAHCPKDECMRCGEIVCPGHEPLHLHHDGCPFCVTQDAAIAATSPAPDGFKDEAAKVFWSILRALWVNGHVALIPADDVVPGSPRRGFRLSSEYLDMDIEGDTPTATVEKAREEWHARFSRPPSTESCAAASSQTAAVLKPKGRP